MNLFTTKKRLREKKKIFGIQVYNNEEAIQELLKEDKITSHLWNKLYKKELWENIYFPEGKTLEDIAVMYKVFERSKKVVYIDNKLYYYRQRGNSILGNINEKLMKDYIEFVQVRYENLKEKYPMLEKEIAYNRINTLLRIHLITVRKKELYDSEIMKKQYQELCMITKKFPSYFKEKSIPKKFRVFAKICCKNRKKFLYITKIFYKIKQKAVNA